MHCIDSKLLHITTNDVLLLLISLVLAARAASTDVFVSQKLSQVHYFTNTTKFDSFNLFVC